MRKRITRAIVGAALGAGLGIGATEGMRFHAQRNAEQIQRQVAESYKGMLGKEATAKQVQQNVELKKKLWKEQERAKNIPKNRASAVTYGAIAGGLLGFARKPRKKENKKP